MTENVIKMKEEDLKLKPLTFKVSEGAVSYNCFLTAFVNAGFEQTTSNSFNVMISGVPKPEFMRDLNSYQKI